MYDLILRGGQVVDGRGTEPRTTDVAVSGHRIVAVGDLAPDEPATTTLDAAGLVVCPGFVESPVPLLPLGPRGRHVARGARPGRDHPDLR